MRFEEDDFYYEDEEEEFLSEVEPMFGLPAGIMEQWKSVETQNEQTINTQILNQAMLLCQMSWFWKFRNINSKLKMIIETYYALSDIVKEG